MHYQTVLTRPCLAFCLDMASAWNKVSLQRPKITICRYNPQEWTFIAELVKKSAEDLKDGLEIFAKPSELHVDIALFGRLVYKSSNVMRGQKLLTATNRVQKCLKRYLAQKIYLLLDDLRSHLNTRLGPPYSCSYVQLPSQQYVHFVLVKLQGWSGLFCRTLIDLESSFCHIHDQLRQAVGQHFISKVVMLTCCARLWVIFKALILKCIEWYASLHQLADELKQSDEKWMTAIELPSNLKEWLIKLSEENAKYLNPPDQKSTTTEDETKLLLEYFAQGPKNKNGEPISLSGSCMDFDIDLGATVSREEFELALGAQYEQPPTSDPREAKLPSLIKSLKQIKGVNGLRKFLKEDMQRKKKGQKRYTSHMSPSQRKTFILKCRSLMQKLNLKPSQIRLRVKKWLAADGDNVKAGKKLRAKPKTRKATKRAMDMA